ncbi:unnamed protein product [Protopolystoma xenopodis]|uniref:Glycoside hydrolase family 3 C-terminal domain-containing protein n=1 Tax=Protopolystoma xenopodis TaxID=117903 RepID=A0A448XCR7_9PLAT|nr:unnamed protein product [Protopolystoma xenopodis]
MGNPTKRLDNMAIIGPFSNSVKEIYGDYGPPKLDEYEVPLSKESVFISSSTITGLRNLAKNLTSLNLCADGGRCSKWNKSQLVDLLASSQLDLIILTLGTGENVVGENRDLHNYDLPGRQGDILKELLRLNAMRPRGPVPIFLLVFTAGPIDIQTAVNSEQVTAIFWAGFPGPLIGEAFYSLLTGVSGEGLGSMRAFSSEEDEPGVESRWWIPAGRLPFTWYADVTNLAGIQEYTMTNQTYRYLPKSTCLLAGDKGNRSTVCKDPIPVAFPFGHGLSYNVYCNKGNVEASGFTYSLLVLPKRGLIRLGQSFVASVVVTNSGMMAADEVVQVCFSFIQHT